MLESLYIALQGYVEDCLGGGENPDYQGEIDAIDADIARVESLVNAVSEIIHDWDMYGPATQWDDEDKYGPTTAIHQLKKALHSVHHPDDEFIPNLHGVND